MPEDNLEALWFEEPLNDCVKLIAAQRGGDYFDAIHLSNMVLKSNRFIAEGGAKNVARRDGMATTVLSAATFIGRIPDYYFQAVGSGTGAIAAWEAALRLEADGRFGPNRMKLMLSQNAPFVPMYDAWRADSRHMLPYDDPRARRDAGIIDAKVLSNRRPPYGIMGGLYDVMKESGGDFFVSTNAALRRAGKLFEQTEGIDIHHAAAVAVDSLIQAERDRRRRKTLQGGAADVAPQAFHRVSSDGIRSRCHQPDRSAVRRIGRRRSFPDGGSLSAGRVEKLVLLVYRVSAVRRGEEGRGGRAGESLSGR